MLYFSRINTFYFSVMFVDFPHFTHFYFLFFIYYLHLHDNLSHTVTYPKYITAQNFLWFMIILCGRKKRGDVEQTICITYIFIRQALSYDNTGTQSKRYISYRPATRGPSYRNLCKLNFCMTAYCTKEECLCMSTPLSMCE